jgi:hypothetical protein
LVTEQHREGKREVVLKVARDEQYAERLATGDTATELSAAVEAIVGLPDSALTSENLVGDPLRARGGSRRAPQTPAAPRGSGQLVIEERVVLSPR